MNYAVFRKEGSNKCTIKPTNNTAIPKMCQLLSGSCNTKKATTKATAGTNKDKGATLAALCLLINLPHKP